MSCLPCLFLAAAPAHPGADLAHLCEALSDESRAVHWAIYASAPGVHPTLQWAHDALFAANPDTRDPKKWDPSYQRLDPRVETMTVSPIENARAAPRFVGVDARFRRSAAARELVEHFLDAPHTRLFWAHWDNRDDTAFDGLLAVDDRTGNTQVLMTNDFA